MTTRQQMNIGARWVLPVHTLAIILVQGTTNAILFMLPIIARKGFGATAWETAIVTAAPLVLFVFSIFWHDLLHRMSLARYLLLYWAVAALPLALMAGVTSLWQLIALHIIASLGGSGWMPVTGEVLRHLYPQSSRGRAFGIITAAMWLGGALASYGVGLWLNIEPDAFRIYLPIAALLQLGGIGILLLLSRATGAFPKGPAAPGRPLAWSSLLAPIVNMRRVLAADRTFYRYEAAFMTYGIGWMICFALVPLLVTDKLNMNYEEVARSTQVALLLAMVVVLVPAGWLIDRIGPSRTSGLSFALLTVYPIGLLLARNPFELAIVSAVYGVAAAGVNVGWMLGPVTLAPTPAQVPQYVAIHSTLVGLRGTLFQGLGVLLYTLSDSFFWPLVVAAASFVWAAIQMWQLHGRIAQEKKAAATLQPGGPNADTLAAKGGQGVVELEKSLTGERA